ncbi:MAG: hypothetical protein GY859_11030, partial [Desulfobacterales bacterium]|nr:hypothetical protein [Desulfobacterales bacterium]
NAARQLPATDTAAPDAGFKWRFLFRRFAPRRPGVFDLYEFIKAYTTALTERLPTAHRDKFTAQLIQKAAPAMRNAGAAREWFPPPLKEEPSPPAPAPPPARPLEEDFTEEIFIYNSGIVLASPWLPRLMTMLHLTEKGQFKDRRAAERAIHVLQYLVDERTDAPEYQLVLNKVLCGLKTGAPIAKSIDMEEFEKEAADGLIKSMIHQWKILKNTSVQGFRETFLARDGRLLLKEDRWELEVIPKPFDMLLDQIPWSFNVIKHPWMAKAVYVKWR